MKKLAIILAVAIVGSIGFTSCKKCSTCKIYDSSNNSLIYTYPEVCGKKSEIDTYEKAAETAYSGSGYKVECTN